MYILSLAFSLSVLLLGFWFSSNHFYVFSSFLLYFFNFRQSVFLFCMSILCTWH
jgi:hypothetical protein